MRAIAFFLFCLGLVAGALAQDRAFDFALIGDMPYTRVQEREYQRVLAALNASELGFVVHVGDFQFDPRGYNRNPAASAMPCVQENEQTVFESFQSIRHPLIFTPGDNDWSDCWLLEAKKIDPLENLARLRARFFPDGRSLGQRTIPLRQQSANPRFSQYRENQRWSMGGVLFVTLHTVGDNDNFGRSPEMDAEHAGRKAANLAWLREAFAEARANNRRGVVILTQANPRFETAWHDGARRRYFKPSTAAAAPAPGVDSGFADYLEALADELETYAKPVAYLHGDTHFFRVDKPLFSAKSRRAFQNFMRVETFGWPDSHWVRVTVDPADPQLFRFQGEVVPANVVQGVR